MKQAARDNRYLREERSACLKEARDLQAKGNLSSADQRKFDGLMQEAESLKQEYEQLESRAMGQFKGGGIDGGLERRDDNTKEK